MAVVRPGEAGPDQRGAQRGGEHGGSDAPGGRRGSDTAEGGIEPPEPRGGVAGVAQANTPEGMDLTLPLLLLAVAVAAAFLARSLRHRPTPLPAEAPRAAWVPWRRSTMDGPGWNDPRPAGDREAEWSGEPAEAPEHEPWTPPTRRAPTRRP
jgi:hypothetical protein